MPIVRSRGLGGGGSLYGPRVSPHDSNLMFVACDMTGLYRSADSGRNWTMLDEREVRGSIRFSVAFNPNVSGHVIASNPTEGLMESTNGGVTWAKYSPALPVGAVAEGVTAVGFPRECRCCARLGE
jgi:hypothetical protein